MKQLSSLSRRTFLGGLGAVSITGCAATAQRLFATDNAPSVADTGTLHGSHLQGDMPDDASAGQTYDPLTLHALHQGNILQGDVDPAAVNGFDPTTMLTDFDYGTVSTLPNGQTLREYTITAVDKQIEIAPGITFPAWTYNGRVPGPTLRCTEGDRIRVVFTNGSSHPHSIHFHGFHPAEMDGVTPVDTGARTVYEFDAEPFGLHVYHCHVPPFMRHIHKGLYGLFIVDPPTPRQPARELVMVMNGFDTNFDGGNEIYAVNTVGFHYTKHPIPLKTNERVRIYLANFTEFDLINSFHIHANLFYVYRTGTSLEPSEFTDLIMLCQAERHILEFTYTRPGQYMFHAHQSEFNQLGWMGLFEVTDSGVASVPFEVAARMGICTLS